jgi:protease IV
MSRLLLELDLTEPLLEAPPTDPVGWLQARRQTSVRAVLNGLRDAAADPRVAGLVAKVGGPVGLARAQELRDAVAEFARSGKPAVAWAESFGEFSAGTLPYLLATGFSEVWLQPSGTLGLTGVAVEVTFLRGVFDKLGVEIQVDRRKEYKNAVDRFVGTEFTDAYREAATRYADSAYEQIVAAIADRRGLSADEVREIVDRAPLLADEALAARLVDRLGYRDEVYADLRRRLGDGISLLYLGRYRKPQQPAEKLARVARGLGDRVAGQREQVVALVSATGTIRSGSSGRGPLGGTAMGADTVTAALRSAAREPTVRAVVLRVDSPGGSAVASDTIWRAVARVRAGGKPVIVSMGELAASGGYYISMGADVIVAQPGTLTGSIGVFGGKAVLTGLLERAGVTTDAVQAGRHARIMSPRRRFDEDETVLLGRWMDAIYTEFVGKAARGRNMTYEALDAVAGGRVWTGADAAERGLVDELGGLDRASDLARKRAGLAVDAPVVRWPARGPLDALRRPKNSEAPTAATAAGWGGFAALAARLGLPAGGPLLMPPLTLR